MTRLRRHDPPARDSDRAALVGLASGPAVRDAAEHSLEELAGLADAVGAEVRLALIQERPRPDPATFLGSGKLETLRLACDESDVNIVIFDNELTPAQLRNLEKTLDRRVVDRTQVILDIFARRARTREGKLQVELAQLKYLLPRLVGAGAALSRLGGGIGTRGPGETKLETDRRRLRDRIASITREIAAVKSHRDHLRAKRQQGAAPTVALVGYTNAGKTTLFNRLTRADAVASDALFVTLDPLVRQVRLPEGPTFMVSDTVGFIDRLPHTLVAAFRATLEEVSSADLLLHVVDASTPDLDRHIAAVRTVLDEVDALDVPALLLLNKCDCLDADERTRVRTAHPAAFELSALAGDGIDQVLRAVAERLALDVQRYTLTFAPGPDVAARIARLYKHARVVSHQDDGRQTVVEVDVPRRVAAWLVEPMVTA